MSKLYKGIVVAADSKAGVVAAFSDVATGKSVRYMASESGAVYATNGIAYDPCGHGVVKGFEGVENAEFASVSAEAEANLTVCLDGCQRFILSESTLQRCPSCSAALTASEDDIHDLVFGSESDDLLLGSDPLFCGTEEQATAFASALRTGTVPSLSGESATLNFDPFNGSESVRSCSNVAEFSGVFHKFHCAASCSHPVTLSTSADIVFCAHCNAPLEEPENMIKKIGKIDQRLHVFAPSVSAALNGMRDLLLNGGAAKHFDHKLKDENFVSNSSCAYNPYTGNNVASSVMDSLSGAGEGFGHDALNIHLFKCHDGCGFMATSSEDANFCSECNSPLVEPSEDDLADLPAVDEVSEEGSDIDSLESDLAELDADIDAGNEDLLSASGEEEEFEEEDGEDLDLDLGDDGESLSGDDFDDEDEESPEFEDDEDEDEEEEEDEDDFEESADFTLNSESGDDEEGGEGDEDTMLTDEELSELEFNGEDEDNMESESSVISISAAEALVAGAEFNLNSLSTVFDGVGRYHAIYENTPLGSLTFTALSNALGDEAKAKLLFRNGTLPSVLSASARENGIEQALNDLGFEPVKFEVSVSNVLAQRASKSADERAERLNGEVDAIVSESRERFEASVSTAIMGLTRGFWNQDSNAVADVLVNKMVASGMSLSSARGMVVSAFAEQGAELTASIFARAQYLSSMSVDAYNEVSRAIEEINVASVSSGATEIGKTVKKPEQPAQKIESNSSAAPTPLTWEQKLALL